MAVDVAQTQRHRLADQLAEDAAGYSGGLAGPKVRMPPMEQSLRVGGVFGAAFSAFRARARVLVPIALVSILLFTATTTLLGQGAIGVVVSYIVDTAYFAFLAAIAMGVLCDLREGRPASSAGELCMRALPPLPAAILVDLLASIAFVGAAVLLFVPALYLVTIWAVILPVVVVERPGVFNAFGRSRRLVRGNGWKVFGIVLLLALILIATILPLFLLGPQVDAVVRRLVGVLVSACVNPFLFLVIGTLYHCLLDLEQPSSVLEQTGDSPS